MEESPGTERSFGDSAIEGRTIEKITHRILEFVEKGPNHSNSVFNLGELLIVVTAGNGLTGENIEFVTQKDERRPQVLFEVLLDRPKVRYRPASIGRRDGLECRKVFPMIGESDRNHSDRPYRRKSMG